jgi:hypothetical protein
VSKPKKTAAPETEKIPKKTTPCQSELSIEEKRRRCAKVLSSPDFAAYRVISIMQPKSLENEIDPLDIVEILREQAAAVQGGDLKQPEAMLMNQAVALQAVFVRLSERALEQTHMPNLEGFMRLALRAQSQCRATLETLSAIKNPPIVYTKQANIAQGHQQVNNGIAEPSRAREIKNEQDQLSEDTHELPQDTRTSRNESRVNPTLETVGEIDRAKVRGG